MSKIVLSRELLWEAGAQIGHHKSSWNPKMKKFIYGIKSDWHIINLNKTINLLKQAHDFLYAIGEEKGKILIVGIEPHTHSIVEDLAKRSNNYFVIERWLGGTLTNLTTIHKNVKKLYDIERKFRTQEINKLPKKEQLSLIEERKKLEKKYSGIKLMRNVPKVLIVANPTKSLIAIQEARKLNIPVIAICDTNSDPEIIDYIIPSNDDYYKATKIILSYLIEGYAEGYKLELPESTLEDPKIIEKKESKIGSNYKVVPRLTGYTIPIFMTKDKWKVIQDKKDEAIQKWLTENVKSKSSILIQPNQKEYSYEEIYQIEKSDKKEEKDKVKKVKTKTTEKVVSKVIKKPKVNKENSNEINDSVN